MRRKPPPKQTSNIGRRRATARGDARDGYVERRREIARAAAQVFKERGFGRTTLNHVADALGTDRASLYYYVGSKDELFEDLVSDAVRLNLNMARSIRDEDAPAPDKLRRLIVGLMESYAEDYPVLYVLIQENLDHVGDARADWAGQMKEINTEFVDVLIEIIEAGQREGTLAATTPPWLVAYAVMGMLGWTNRWFRPDESPASAEEIGTAFADTVLNGLVLEAPAARVPAAKAAGAKAPATTKAPARPKKATKKRA
jgi:TetR/AcrR family transcriptional regulator, cholesterol catabolism regulator